ncbi:MAG: hypothetical protein NPIRA02_27910 [Nitrospirales bacterium]|nr:MAG: hypothetical protein NPIRA02_27910 [Nitrospirales bacterium]
MIDPSPIPDYGIRRDAETICDRNVVVVAGAGTGKTTLLVNRLLSVLLREPDPIPITNIVALTFTNKAATEMKMRLRDQLRGLVNWDRHADESAAHHHMARFQEAFRLSSTDIMARAQAALDDVEQAQIGTLHSFAAHLLRLYPLESGVPPNFREDDGSRFHEYFAREWDAWIDDELGPRGTQHERWKSLLAHFRFEALRGLAFDLSLDMSMSERLLAQTETTDISRPLREWFRSKRDRMEVLLSSYRGAKPRKIEQALGVASQVLTVMLEQGLDGLRPFPETERNLLCANLGKSPRGWTEEDFSDARALIRLAYTIFSVDHPRMHALLQMLVPFARHVQRTFIRDGWMTFQDLLTRARALLRDYAVVRERLKQEFQAILVDEFQDTDPIQYEIVLYLCETRGTCASDWRTVQLTPGKLFIVGDPKQSIYTFRGADLEAFDHVISKIRDDGGMLYELTTNFRSHHHVLNVVNDVFDRLLQPQKHIQPGNIRLTVSPNRHERFHAPGVAVRVVQLPETHEDTGATSVTRLEAEQLALWIKDHVLKKEMWLEESGTRAPLRPGHIGLLFRKLTQAHVYLEALQRHGIPYVTDGEKHFYRRTEVIDLMNVLRVLVQPGDAVGMLGLLRSPLGGLNDREIYELQQLYACDYRQVTQLDRWTGPRKVVVQKLYAALRELHEQAFRYPLGEMIEKIFSRLPILELAMASRHGEQAVANLKKVQSMATEMEDRPLLTVTGFVNLLVTRLHEQPSEAERSLAEESLDAVRVLTIHKAKGLEFPIVIVPGLHHGAQTGANGPTISSDWATEVVGLSMGASCTLGSVLTREKARVKEEAEQRRLLYVAMTRAQERVVLSCGIPKRQAAGTFLRLLQEVTADTVGSPECEMLTLQSTSIPQTIIPPSDPFLGNAEERAHMLPCPLFVDSWLQRWAERDRAWKERLHTASYLTPTLRKPRGSRVEALGNEGALLRGRGTFIGSLIHRVLEQWDFSADRHSLERHIAAVCAHLVLHEGTEERQAILRDVCNVLDAFLDSPAYAMLQGATIRGREVPFTIPWDCVPNGEMAITDGAGVMEGVIDLVYERDGRVGLVDYKTDRIAETDIPERMRVYQEQADIYKQAAQRCLALHEVQCQFIFLRLGHMIVV